MQLIFLRAGGFVSRKSGFFFAASLLFPLISGLFSQSAFAQNAISTGTRAGFRMYYPNSNDWWLDPSKGNLDIRANGGAPLATLNKLGSLGIGTTNPAQHLQLTKSQPTIRLENTVGPRTWDIAIDNTGGGVFQIRDITGSIIPLVVNTGGNVGIGTQAPSSPLHVRSGAPGVYVISAESVNGQPGLLGGYITLPDGVSRTLAFAASYDNNTSRNGNLSILSDGANKIVLDANSANSSYFNAGKVGIGTTNPQEALQVNGRIMAADPGTNPNAVATKQYVDAAAAGGVKTWFRPAGYFQGNAAGLSYPSTGVCGAGYHMCYINEWVGRKWDQSKESPPYLLYENAWVATYSYHMGNNYWHSLPSGANPDCANWSGLSDGGGSFYGTYVNMGGAPPTFGTTTCASSYKVMCCQD